MIISTFALLLCLFNFCRPSTVTSEVQEITPAFSRKCGPSSDSSQHYMTALVSALYSIPSVQKAFYEESQNIKPKSSDSKVKNVCVKLFVKKFAKMRFDSAEVDLGENTVRAFQSVELLWTQILLKLPKSIQNLFSFKLSVEVIQHTDPITVHHLYENRTIKSVVVGSNFTSIHQTVMNHFGDEITNKKAQEKMKVEHRVEYWNKIESQPEVLTLRLNRLIEANQEGPVAFDNSPIYIDKYILINQSLYILAARIELDTKKNSYSSVVRDFGDMKSYRYDGFGNVQVEEEAANGLEDTKSILLFYVPKSSIDVLDVTGLRNFHDIPSSLIDSFSNVCGTKRSRDEIEEGQVANKRADESAERFDAVTDENYANVTDDSSVGVMEVHPADKSSDKSAAGSVGAVSKSITTIDLTGDVSEEQTKVTTVAVDPSVEELWSKIYKPDSSKYPPQLQKHIEFIQNVLKKQIGNFPIALINLQSKIYHKNYLLGIESCSFKPGPDGKPYDALEIILAALASNSKIVLKLFSSYETGCSPFEASLAVVLAKILLGCKGISLEKFNKSLGIPDGHTSCILHLKKVTKMILKEIDPSLMQLPSVNTVIYENQDSDDPIKVFSRKSWASIKPKDLIPQREAHIKGIWFDSVGGVKRRKRTIFKSKAEMFVVEVERWPTIGGRIHFDQNYLKFGNGSDYYCSGVVTLGEKSSNFDSFFVDNFSRNTKFRNHSPGKEANSYQMTEGNKALFDRYVERESVLLFFSKNDGQEKTIILSKSLPKNLFKAVLIDYAEDLDFKLNENK